MGMPDISLDFIDRDQALNNLIASIALQEAALSNILNADGDKLHAAMRMVGQTDSGLSPLHLLDADDSSNDLIKSVSDIENLLREKLGSVLDYIQIEQENCPDTTTFHIYTVDISKWDSASPLDFASVDYATLVSSLPLLDSAGLTGAAFSASARVKTIDPATGRSDGFINIVRQGETTKRGELVFGVPYNHDYTSPIDFTLRQIIAPDGYILDKTPITITVAPDGTLTANVSRAGGFARWLDDGGTPILLVGNYVDIP